MRAWALAHPADVVDVFVYVVVLNLAVQYVPTVLSETFTLSLLTAVLLKVALEGVLALKSRGLGRLRSAEGWPGRVTSALMLWALAAGSKLVVLWLVEVTFRGSVSLGGFVPVTALVVTLMLARGVVRRLLDPAQE